jgi:hypothetical protein
MSATKVVPSGENGKPAPAARRHPPPAREHRRAESSVGKDERPPWRIVVQQPRQPVLDEAALVAGLAREPAEVLLPDRQGAEPPEPGLRDDEGHGAEVHQAKAAVPHPAPAQRSADKYERQSTDDESDHGYVHHENDIREQLGAGRIHGPLCTTPAGRQGAVPKASGWYPATLLSGEGR